jgi:hypothetical protein
LEFGFAFSPLILGTVFFPHLSKLFPESDDDDGVCCASGMLGSSFRVDNVHATQVMIDFNQSESSVS